MNYKNHVIFSLITPFCVHIHIAQSLSTLLTRRHHHWRPSDTALLNTSLHWVHKLHSHHPAGWDSLRLHQENLRKITAITAKQGECWKGLSAGTLRLSLFCFGICILQLTHGKDQTLFPFLFPVCLACTPLGLALVLPSPIFRTAWSEAHLAISQMGKRRDQIP